jgi:hypothetical protein
MKAINEETEEEMKDEGVKKDNDLSGDAVSLKEFNNAIPEHQNPSLARLKSAHTV